MKNQTETQTEQKSVEPTEVQVKTSVKGEDVHDVGGQNKTVAVMPEPKSQTNTTVVQEGPEAKTETQVDADVRQESEKGHSQPKPLIETTIASTQTNQTTTEQEPAE